MNSRIRLFEGTAHPQLGRAVARELGIEPALQSLERTPDGELLVRLEALDPHDVVAIVQPTAAPVGEHLLDLLLMADACWRFGVQRVTAVIPYLGYARQDRRSGGGEPLGARVVAGLLATGRFERVLTVDPHNSAIEGGFACPLEQLTAVPLLASALAPYVEQAGVIVAPDVGAMKLAERMARLLGLPVATVHKQRLGPREVVAQQIIGNVRGLVPIIVDDIISTGGTIAAAAKLLLQHGARAPFLVAATHGLFAGQALETLQALPLARVFTTDSVPPQGSPFALETISLAPLLASAIRRSGLP